MRESWPAGAELRLRMSRGFRPMGCASGESRLGSRSYRRIVFASTFSDLNGSDASSTSAPRSPTILKVHLFCDRSAWTAGAYLARTSSDHEFPRVSARPPTDVYSDGCHGARQIAFFIWRLRILSPQLWQHMSSAWSLLRYAPSPPTRGRGLKPIAPRVAQSASVSPPTRGRGLKPH